MAELEEVKLNNLGIPKAEFMEDVDAFMSKDNKEAVTVLKYLDELHAKYRFMEISLLTKKRRLKIQVPDIKASLDAVNMLKNSKEKQESLETKYLLSDQVYCKVVIPPKTNTVGLYLGANVMLEYSLDEAITLLSKNLILAKKNLAQIDADLNFVKDQITTTEVNMARVYNWDVKRRKNNKENS